MSADITATRKEFYLNEMESCPVCGHTRLRFFSRDHCRHTAEEWAKASSRRIIRALKDSAHDR